MNIVLKSKRSKKAQPNRRQSHEQKQLVWPQDFVDRPHSLAEIIEAKINSQTCDDDAAIGDH